MILETTCSELSGDGIEGSLTPDGTSAVGGGAGGGRGLLPWPQGRALPTREESTLN